MVDPTIARKLDPALLARWAVQLRAHLPLFPDAQLPITYQTLARALALPAPQTIHRVVLALELTMIPETSVDRSFSLAAF